MMTAITFAALAYIVSMPLGSQFEWPGILVLLGMACFEDIAILSIILSRLTRK